ncbi:MAG: EscR/YscR/HrcR family type III secretion system export apparatus protein [Pseudomonadota bacterium]
METATGPLALGFLAGFSILAVLTLTSFIKISVVFMIVRQALGLQQVPSNMIIMALSGFLAVFISLPVFREALFAINQIDADANTADGIMEMWSAGIAPFQRFLLANIDPVHIDFFISMSNDLWAGSGMVGSRDILIIQVPAFIISELTEAFRIGFLIYLPFVAIDIAVTTILMALGMQQVQPTIIATPFKLLTFVFVSGWARLSEGLIMTYAGNI